MVEIKIEGFEPKDNTSNSALTFWFHGDEKTLDRDLFGFQVDKEEEVKKYAIALLTEHLDELQRDLSLKQQHRIPDTEPVVTNVTTALNKINAFLLKDFERFKISEVYAK